MHFTDFIPLLASDAYHTAQQLSARLQISTKKLADFALQAQASGVQIDFSQEKGYRLKSPLDLIDPTKILEMLTPEVTTRLESHTYLRSVTSTNELALRQACPADGKFSFVTTEMQTAGRGRRGRKWQSPFAANIYLSIIWPLRSEISQASTLSPYLALEVVELLNDLSIPKLGLKWPNDVFCANKKMSGLLIESVYKSQNKMQLVIGLGINVGMSIEQSVNIDQNWTDIKSQCPEWSLNRSEFIAHLINTLVTALVLFENEGVLDLKNRWRRWDITYNKAVNLSAQDEDIKGVAKGVNEDGNLLLEVNGQQQKIIVGDVSLRTLE